MAQCYPAWRLHAFTQIKHFLQQDPRLLDKELELWNQTPWVQIAVPPLVIDCLG